ncbi:uncharacterized protein LOC141600662 [Silene latifolia]|uniref:uncharacterized protein LOC141600662 n=1 Tax=Silene latifolia TaxID=37657 RepID=UPI003D7779AA
MARKSSQQRQREMNLRGRSIPATSKELSITVEDEENMETLETDEEDETEEEMDASEEEEEIVCDSVKQGTENPEHDKKTESDEMLQIQLEDVEDEIEYWKQAVICFILGANLPWEIVEGFIRRIWTKFNIDKISFMPNGIFLVRFKTMEMKENVLNSGHYLFDIKPMIVKSWEKDLEMKKDDVKSVPAWIKIHKLPLKFWGKGLPKVTSIVGKFVKCDVATEERTRLGYARVMVELLVDQQLPSNVSFKMKIEVWRPVTKKAVTAIEPVPVRQVPQNQVRQTRVDVSSSAGFHTPIKRLVKLNTREVVKDGYSTKAFGAFSYKEVAASPPKKSAGENGNANNNIGLFGLLESKIKNKAFNKAASSFSNWCITTNNGYHFSGRIWVIWNPNLFRVQVLEYNAQYVHLKVESLVDRRVFWLTMVYAFNGIHDRDSLWDNLRRLASLVSRPWAVAGDFNCVLSATERVGGNTLSGEMEPFRRCVADCGVVDIAAVGALYTWNNKQKPEERIYSRIDRFLVNKAWLAKNLKNLKPVLKSLNKEGFSDIENATNILQKQVEEMQGKINQDPTNLQVISDEYEATLKLQELIKANESFLSQKTKHQWIKEGDANIAYFHGMLKRRRNMNKVVMVEDMNGKMCDNQEQIQEAFIEYYQNLLGSSQETKKIHKRIIGQGPICNDEHWNSLLKPVTGLEIKEALFSIPDIKSLGPDGYTSKFFKDALGEIGGDVNAVQDFFQHKQLLKQLNATNLTLIPKSIATYSRTYCLL